MAQFLGKVQGGRGEAQRLGHQSTGLVTVAASWDGAIRTTLRYNEKTERDEYMVERIKWQGVGRYELIRDWTPFSD